MSVTGSFHVHLDCGIRVKLEIVRELLRNVKMVSEYFCNGISP